MAVRGLGAGDRLVALDAKYGSFVQAQLATPAEFWSDELLADVRSVRVDDFTVSDVAAEDCLDLILLARRP
jgi:hypothetical protein